MPDSQAFVLDLQKFAKKAQGRMDLVVKKIALEVLTGIVMKTPVDTGRARGNWQVDIGSFALGNISAFDPAGSGTIARGLSVINRQKGEQALYIVNNLPYILRLEDGYSKQAPAGMVELTLQQYPYIVQRATKAAKAGAP